MQLFAKTKLKVLQLAMNNKVHLLGVPMIIISTLCIALDYGATFTGYIDFFLGNLIAYFSFTLFLVSLSVEILAMFKNRPRIWITILLSMLLSVCSILVVAYFPAFLLGRVSTPL
jgi:hypothetical protein